MAMAMLLSGVFCTRAQNQNSVNRKGFTGGLALGIAHVGLDFPAQKHSGVDLAINWKIGYVLSAKMTLLLNGSVSTYNYRGIGRPRKRDFGGVFPSLQYQPYKRVWILGGIGLGTDAPVFYDIQRDNPDEIKYHTGYGAIAAIGFELYQGKKITCDLQARFNFTSLHLPEGRTHGFTSGVLLGFNIL